MDRGQANALRREIELANSFWGFCLRDPSAPSVRGRQPAHSKFDRAIRKFAPPLYLAHVSSRRIRF